MRLLAPATFSGLLAVARLHQPKVITNRAIVTTDVLPLQSSGIDNRDLAETILARVQDGGDVAQTLTGAQLAVTLDVSGHAVDDMGHGCSSIGLVGVVVDDRGSVDLVVAKGEEALVPVDVAG